MTEDNINENIDERLKGIENNIRKNMSLSSVPVLMEAIRTHPDHPHVNYLLGLSHYKNRNLEKAMHYALRAVELDGTGDAYLTLLAKLYAEDGDDKAAESYAQAAFARNPANWEAALVLAKMSFEKNDLPRALELVDQVIKHTPKSFAALRLKSKIRAFDTYESKKHPESPRGLIFFVKFIGYILRDLA